MCVTYTTRTMKMQDVLSPLNTNVQCILFMYFIHDHVVKITCLFFILILCCLYQQVECFVQFSPVSWCCAVWCSWSWFLVQSEEQLYHFYVSCFWLHHDYYFLFGSKGTECKTVVSYHTHECMRQLESGEVGLPKKFIREVLKIYVHPRLHAHARSFKIL